ncbi:MAG: 50S ribosomal protein L4 [Kiritimatiellia bacterium]|jgi:large subunit ribosomal protein L4
MSTIKKFSISGESAGELEFDASLLVLDKGAQAVKDTLDARAANQRAGTASTLGKGEVRGSNKKLWRQKGTGRARTGLRQSPLWRGGGVAHGPRPRVYARKINRKVALLAFRRALSERLNDGGLVVIESFDPAEAKTKLVAAVLAKMGLDKGTCLIVDEQPSDKLLLAARNLPKVDVAKAASVDVYCLLRFRTVVATEAGYKALIARLAKQEGEA